MLLAVPLETEGRVCREEPQGKARVSQEAEREEKLKSTAFIGVSVQRARQGRVNSSGLASLNNSSGLWGHSDCPSLSSAWPSLG